MNADITKRIFRGIFSEDIIALKKIATQIILEERKLGHDKLADSLEHIIATEKPKFQTFGSVLGQNGLRTSLPTSRRDNLPLVTYIPTELLRHHMVLPDDVENRILSIEKEYAAKERLSKYNLTPKKKILLHGAPGCGKTLSAERIAWNIGLPLLKVRFDSLLSSYFGESASNLRSVFDYCNKEPVVLLLDECDFIAKSRVTNQDVGEMPRIVNMLLTLLDEYSAPGLVISTTNLKLQLDEAIFRRFDDIIEIPIPTLVIREKLLRMTLSAIPVDTKTDFHIIAKKMEGYSSASVVQTAQRAAKISILQGAISISAKSFEQAISDNRQE